MTTALTGRGGVWFEGGISLEAAGYSTIDDQALEGYHRCYTHDPFGNRIELMERVGEL